MDSPIRDVAVVDDDDALREAVCQALELDGLTPRPFSSGDAALASIDRSFPGIVLTDLRMPGMDGLALFAALHIRDPDLPVIVFTGHGDIVTAVDLMQRGAYDFIAKPFASGLLLPSVARALEKRTLVLENRRLKAETVPDAGLRLIGESRSIANIREIIAQLAGTDISVMIDGETGTGKGLVAALLHSRSKRASRPMVTIDCSALPAHHADSYLFGHASGGVAGAQFPRTGQLMRAHGSSLFLDKADCLTPELQARIARVLEDGEVLPLGANQPLRLDVRLISTCVADLRDTAFNPALGFRLSEYQITIPPLRARREDIVPLFRAFLLEASNAAKREPPMITPAIWHRLQSSDWPGNAHELKSYALAVASGLDQFEAQPASVSGTEAAGLKQAVEQFEDRLVREALQRTGGDVRKTIALLQLPRKTFYDKLARYGIDIAAYRPAKD